MSENPYVASQVFDSPPALDSDAEVIRKEHIKTEASIKSLGILYFLGGVFLLFGSIAALTTAPVTEGVTGLGEQAAYILFLILGIFQFFLGAAVRKLKPWSRIGVGILSTIGLIGFPIGTLISAYILYLVLGKKGKMVFSPEYKEIIAATPHIKYRTPKIVWIILGILVLILILIVALGIVAIAAGN
ncbi:MAG: hypothetical protein V4640_03205 [Verrucomicrobiota bacterium]